MAQSTIAVLVFRLTLILMVLIVPARADWSQSASGVDDDLYDMFFLDADTGWATGWSQTGPGAIVLRTTDGGESWHSARPVAGCYLFSVCFIDGQSGFAAGCDAGGTFHAMILRTDDGGKTWTISLHDKSYGFYAVEFPSSAVGYACGWVGAIYKTTDGGDSWKALSSGTGDVFRWMHFTDDSHGFAVCGTNYNNPSRIYKTVDGTDWSEVHDFGSSMIIGGLHFFDADTGIVVGHNDTEVVMKTYDGGTTWHTKFTGVDSVAVQGLAFDGDVGWAVGGQGRIIKTTDRGETWSLEQTVSPANTLLSVDGASGAAFVGGALGTIYKSAVTIDADDDAGQ